MRTLAAIGMVLSLTIFIAPDAAAQGRGMGRQRGMRGRSANESQNRMNQRRQMQNRGAVTRQRGRGQQMRAGQCLNGNFGAGLGSGTSRQLTQLENDSILLLREEEKLARDVYLTLGKKWNSPIFKNISQSESRHMAVMKMMVDKYGLKDPVMDDTVGVFASPEFSRLYRELVATGSASLADAYNVGVKIEELDIKDLQDALAHIKNSDIRRVYQNLLRASENHLRAFSSR